MRLTQIRDFIAVAEAGSLRGAARGRGVSQPTMTKSLRALEAELRVRLVHRTTQGIVPTAAGRAFLARARAVQGELRKADEELAQLAGERSGTVAFGVQAAGMLLIPDALVQFRRQYPNAYVRVVEGGTHALLPLVSDETLDFCLAPRALQKHDPRIRSRVLFHVPLIVVGRRGHPLRGARALRQLLEAPWLMFAASGWPGALLEQAFSAASLTRPRSLIQCESYAAAISLLARTETLALLPPQQLAEPTARGFLQQIAIDDPLPPLTFVILSRAEPPLAPVAAAMAKAITAAARQFAQLV